MVWEYTREKGKQKHSLNAIRKNVIEEQILEYKKKECISMGSPMNKQ